MELKNVKNPWKARCVGKSIFSDGSVCTNSQFFQFKIINNYEQIETIITIDGLRDLQCRKDFTALLNFCN